MLDLPRAPIPESGLYYSGCMAEGSASMQVLFETFPNSVGSFELLLIAEYWLVANIELFSPILNAIEHQAAVGSKLNFPRIFLQTCLHTVMNSSHH